MSTFLLLASTLAAFPAQVNPVPTNEPVLSGKPLSYWVKELDSTDVLSQEEAILVLGQAGPAAQAAAPALISLLKANRPNVRVRAALALVKVDPQTRVAAPVLVDAWKVAARPLRLQILTSLSSLQELARGDAKDMLPLLLQAAGDADPQVRAQALDTIVRLGPAAAPALAKTLAHPDIAMRREAITQLGRIGTISDAVLPDLVARLKDEDWDIRFRTAQALWQLKRPSPEVTAIIVEAAEKPEPSVRRTAITTLVLMKPWTREMLPALRAALKDTTGATRVQVAEAVWGLDKQAAAVLPVLQEALQNSASLDALTRRKILDIISQLEDEAKPLRPILLEALKVNDYDLRVAIPPVLARLGPESVPDLVRLITAEPSNNAYFPAAQTLGHIGKPAVRELIPLLDHQESRVRMSAFQALDMIGPHAADAVPAIRKALKGGDDLTRQRAAICLGRIGPAAKEAIPDLLNAWKDASPNLRAPVVSTLIKVGAQGEQVRDLLKEALKTGSVTLRLLAAEHLWYLDRQPDDIMPSLLELLKSQQLVQSVGRLVVIMGPAAKEAVPLLTDMLQSSNYSSRSEALRVLEQLTDTGLKNKDLAAQLVKTLQQPEPSWKLQVVRALRKLGAEEKTAIDTLIEMIDKSTPYRSSALTVLAEFGPTAKDAVPRLQTYLQDPQTLARLHTAEAIIALDPGQAKVVQPVLQDLMRSSSTTYGVTAAVLLWRLEPSDAKLREFVTTKLKDPNSPIRHMAATAIGKCGPAAKEFIPDLTEVLKDADKYVRLKAAEALGKVNPGDSNSVNTLVALMQDEKFTSRLSAVTALGELGPSAREAVPALQALATDPNSPMRLLAADALRKINPTAVPVVP